MELKLSVVEAENLSLKSCRKEKPYLVITDDKILCAMYVIRYLVMSLKGWP